MPTYDPRWTDMSDFVVHFTKPTGPRSAYDNAIGILAGGRIEARGVFGMARGAPDPAAWASVCFSEVPLHLLSRLAARRGAHGIGFRKDLVVGRGGGPILYAPLGTPHQAALDAMRARARLSAAGDADPFWRVAPFVDVPGDYPTGSYRFEWEREWRHVGHFDFAPDDVAFLIIPADLHDSARGFFEEARIENTGPAYFCPYIDPYWTQEEVSAALSVSSGA